MALFPSISPNLHSFTTKFFLFCNYALIGAASACIFLTLSVRLIPSPCGLFVLILHVITIVAAVCGGAAATSSSNKYYAAHTLSLVLTSIFQGSVSVLILARTADFLGFLRSNVREDDGVVTMQMVGGLCMVVFCLQWVAVVLGFLLRYYSFLEANNNGDTTRDVNQPAGTSLAPARVRVHQGWLEFDLGRAEPEGVGLRSVC